MSAKRVSKWVLHEVAADGTRRRLGVWEATAGRTFCVGRSRSADVLFGENDLGISRRQLVMNATSGGWKITNTGATDLLRERDGKRVRTSGTLTARDGDVLRISETRLEIRRDAAPPSYCLEIRVDGKLFCRKRLTDSRLTIGALRSPVNDLVVSAEGVSRKQHLAITPKGGGRFFLEDLQSRNGVFLKAKDVDGSDRITDSEIGVDDVFSFGSAVGVIRPVQPEHGAGRLRIVFLAAALILIGVSLVFVRLARSGASRSEPATPLELFVKDWMEADSITSLKANMEALLNATGDDFTQRPDVERLLAALKHEGAMRRYTQRLLRLQSELTASMKRTPWQRSVYVALPVADDADMTRHARDYAGIVADFPRMAVDLSIPEMKLLQRFDASITNDWNRIREQRSRINEAVRECRLILGAWESRHWSPPPSQEELAQWRTYSMAIDEEMGRATEKELREYKSQMMFVGQFWRDLDEWLAAMVETGHEDAVSPEWPVTVAAASSFGPMRWLVEYASADACKTINGIVNDLGDAITVFDRAPILLRAAERIPSRWPSHSAALIAQRYEDEIRTLRAAIHAVLPSEGSSVPDPRQAKDSLRNIAAVLPRLDMPADHIPARLRTAYQPYVNEIGELRRFTLTVAERIYANAVIAPLSEQNELKEVVREMMDYAYMRDDPSRRRQALLHWARTRP